MASVEHHQRERLRSVSKEVHKGVLVEPEALAQESLNSVTVGFCPEASPDSEPDLKRYILTDLL